VLVGVDDVDIPETELEPDPETLTLPLRNGWKGNGVMLELIYAGDRSWLLRKTHNGRAPEEDCCVVSEMELETSIGRLVMV